MIKKKLFRKSFFRKMDSFPLFNICDQKCFLIFGRRKNKKEKRTNKVILKKSGGTIPERSEIAPMRFYEF